MNARLVMVAAAALAIGGSALAEPAKAPAKDAAQSNRPAEVVLASADQVRTPAPANAQASPAPVKRRAARVTTCRCGGQVEEQPQQ